MQNTYAYIHFNIAMKLFVERITKVGGTMAHPAFIELALTGYGKSLLVHTRIKFIILLDIVAASVYLPIDLCNNASYMVTWYVHMYILS